MGVLHSIPLCSRGNGPGTDDTDQNNNSVPTVSASLAATTTSPTTTQPLSLNAPQATSTPRPQSPDPLDHGDDVVLHNENYDDSLPSSGTESSRERNDSGLDHSADELDRRPTFSLDDEDDDDFHEDDEGVFHEDPLMDDTIPLDDDNGLDEGVEDPVERPPEPTVPDEAAPSDDEDVEELDLSMDPRYEDHCKDPTQRAISSLFSELIGDKPMSHGR